jgi:hypothetical protein
MRSGTTSALRAPAVPRERGEHGAVPRVPTRCLPAGVRLPMRMQVQPGAPCVGALRWVSGPAVPGAGRRRYGRGGYGHPSPGGAVRVWRLHCRGRVLYGVSDFAGNGGATIGPTCTGRARWQHVAAQHNRYGHSGVPGVPRNRRYVPGVPRGLWRVRVSGAARAVRLRLRNGALWRV